MARLMVLDIVLLSVAMATACLEDESLSLAEIAFLLGYADQSAFNHAFRKRTGDSPLRFRERGI